MLFSDLTNRGDIDSESDVSKVEQADNSKSVVYAQNDVFGCDFINTNAAEIFMMSVNNVNHTKIIKAEDERIEIEVQHGCEGMDEENFSVGNEKPNIVFGTNTTKLSRDIKLIEYSDSDDENCSQNDVDILNKGFDRGLNDVKRQKIEQTTSIDGNDKFRGSFSSRCNRTQAFDESRTLLVKLKQSIERLVCKNMFPYNTGPLLRHLRNFLKSC